MTELEKIKAENAALKRALKNINRCEDCAYKDSLTSLVDDSGNIISTVRCGDGKGLYHVLVATGGESYCDRWLWKGWCV